MRLMETSKVLQGRILIKVFWHLSCGFWNVGVGGRKCYEKMCPCCLPSAVSLWVYLEPYWYILSVRQMSKDLGTGAMFCQNLPVKNKIYIPVIRCTILKLWMCVIVERILSCLVVAVVTILRSWCLLLCLLALYYNKRYFYQNVSCELLK
jgi:hypothetical protein